MEEVTNSPGKSALVPWSVSDSLDGPDRCQGRRDSHLGTLPPDYRQNSSHTAKDWMEEDEELSIDAEECQRQFYRLMDRRKGRQKRRQEAGYYKSYTQEVLEAVQPSVENSSSEEVDDFGDLDEINLRLLALRSMAPEFDDAKIREAISRTDELEAEMVELVQEAEEASIKEASESSAKVSDCGETAISRFLPEGAGEEEQKSKATSPKLSLLVKKLKNSLERQKRQEEKSSYYSPSQSPIHAEVDGGEYGKEVISLDCDSPTPSMSPPPDSPHDQYQADVRLEDIPEPGERKKSNNYDAKTRGSFEKQSQGLLLAVPSTSDAEPPPPGDEVAFPQLPPLPPVAPPEISCEKQEAVDMELGSDNEAEIEFFKHQKEEVSAWDYRVPKASVASSHVTSSEQSEESSKSGSDMLTFSSEQERHEKFMEAVASAKSSAQRKRRHSTMQYDVVQKKKADNDDNDEEDADTLRLRLLTSMLEKRKKTVENEGTDKVKKVDEKKVKVVTSQKEDRVSLKSKLPSRTDKARKPVPVTNKNVVPAVKKKNSLATKQSVAKFNKTLVKEIIRHPKELMAFEASLRLDLVKNADVDKLVKNKVVRHKHFPNLVKKVVIPLGKGIGISDSEDEKHPREGLFQSSLEQLLKEGRINAESGKQSTVTKTTAVAKPVRENTVKAGPSMTTSQRPSKAVPHQTRQTVTATKTKQFSFNEAVKYLSVEKQKEYQRKMNILRKHAMKTKAKQGKKIAGSSDKTVVPDHNSARVTPAAVGKKTPPPSGTEPAPVASATSKQISDKSGVVKKVKASTAVKKTSATLAIKPSVASDSVQSVRSVRKKALPSSVPGAVKKAHPAKGSNLNLPEEDPEKLRLDVLNSMKKSKGELDTGRENMSNKSEKAGSEIKGILKSKGEVSKVESGPAINESNALCSLNTDDDKVTDVIVGSGNVKDDELNVEQQQLKAKENEVVSRRKELVTGLSRLSAQISHLKHEKCKLRELESLRVELEQNLAEVNRAIARKNERIGFLRGVVRLSHGSVHGQRSAVVALEAECVKAGAALCHTNYRLPDDNSAEVIRKKLGAIEKNAKEIVRSKSKAAETQTPPQTLPPKDDDQEPHVMPLILPSVDQQLPVNVDESTKSEEALASPALSTSSSSSSSSSTSSCSSSSSSSSAPDASPRAASPGFHRDDPCNSSVLAHLRSTSGADSINPHLEICRYELMGKCNDDACAFQHVPKRSA